LWNSQKVDATRAHNTRCQYMLYVHFKLLYATRKEVTSISREDICIKFTLVAGLADVTNCDE